MEHKQIELDIVVPNQTRYLGLIGRIGEDLARELGRQREGVEELAHHLNVVLTEAMTNAIRHAHDGDPDKSVHITITLSDDQLCIRVFDQGQGFDLNGVEEPDEEDLSEHGRGIFLIRSLMDRVIYRRTAECNVLEMWKKLR